MVSRYAPPPAVPVQHPALPTPMPTEQEMAYVRSHDMAPIIRQALVDAFRDTPWDHAIILRVRREDFQAAAESVNIWCGPKLALRVYVTVGKLPDAAMRVMRGKGAKHRSSTYPWGPAPKPSAE